MPYVMHYHGVGMEAVRLESGDGADSSLNDEKLGVAILRAYALAEQDLARNFSLFPGLRDQPLQFTHSAAVAGQNQGGLVLLITATATAWVRRE